MTSRLGHRLQIVGRADDVVGDDVRQMRDDGQHHVVMLAGPSCRCWSRSARQNSDSFSSAVRIGAGQRREDAPAIFEQFGKAGIRAGFFRARERMAGNEMHAVRHMRLHLRDDRGLGRADIGEDRALLQRRRDLPWPPRRTSRPAPRR